MASAKEKIIEGTGWRCRTKLGLVFRPELGQELYHLNLSMDRPPPIELSSTFIILI